MFLPQEAVKLGTLGLGDQAHGDALLNFRFGWGARQEAWG
jgi:hypothetical protein